MMSFQRFIYLHRPLCVIYEVLRWVWHKLFFWLAPRTPVWYGFDRQPENTRKEMLALNGAWYHLARPLYLHEQVYYNLDNALAVNPNIKGFAFVFFMGIGDYLYTTPVLAALKQKYPQIPFYGYVGDKFDRTNSPLVGKLLQENPCFEKVFYFEGTRHPLIWQNYDYSVVLQQVPADFLVIPVYYQHGLTTIHRVDSLCKTFGLPTMSVRPVPCMYFPTQVSKQVREYLQQVKQAAQGKKGVVFLQLDSRSSNYVYPYLKDLIEGLLQQNYMVLSVTAAGDIQANAYIEINIKELSINQTWQLLYLLKQDFPLYVITLNSVFLAASAGLGLPSLGLIHWADKKVHNVWYPNIEMVLPFVDPFLPPEKQICAPQESYTSQTNKRFDYKAPWVLRWFNEKFGAKK